MSFTPLTFSGVSSYSADFQTVLDRAVKIASLPLKALQNENADLLSRKTQLASVGGSVASFASALESLGKVSKQKGLQVTSSDSSKVSVSNTNADAATTYTIDSITSLAKAASETSVAGYANSASTQVSASGTVKLTVGTQDYTINLSPANNNLNGLRSAINALGAGVTASVLTTGTGPNPNYLSLAANTAGATTLKLVEDPTGAPTELLTSANQGTNAVFRLNGIEVSRTSNQVNDVVPGLNFSLLAESSTPVTLTIATQKSRLTDSLEQFVSAYNSLQGSVSQQVGPAAGLLSGDFLVREIQKASREVTSFAGNIALSDLGVTFDSTGKAVFDSAKIQAFSEVQLNTAFEFIGTDSTGLGGLSQRFSQISDPVTGLIKLQQDAYDKTDARLQTQISDLSERIELLQRSTAQRLQAIDALLGNLQAQQTIIGASIDSANLSLYGKKNS
jgi:flagellar hook-associated protein 2